MKTYILSKLDGKTPTLKVTQSTYPQRKTWIVVDSWPAKGIREHVANTLAAAQSEQRFSNVRD